MLGLLSISGIIFSCIYFLTASDKEGGALKKDSDSSVRTARVVANGDILIHDALYYTAKKEDAPLKYFHELPEEMQEKFAKIGQNSTKMPAFLPKKATEEMSHEKHRREIQKTIEKEK